MKDEQSNVDYEIILYSKLACQSNQIETHAVFVINGEFQPAVRQILQILLLLRRARFNV